MNTSLTFSRASVSLALFLVGAAPSPGADWPQFRHDAGRTAASDEDVPAELGLQWVRRLPAPRPAFPTEVRLLYDRSYEPVVRGKRIYVPSMVTDSVTALDTETGEELWRFFAGGPVRFAPAAGRDKVYFVSDDGYLYALKAADGSLSWRFRGLPHGRRDRKLLGNRRLISLWPARGGPVLYGGRVYFAAGLWPAYGTFVHALDAETGEVIWSNSDSNRIPAANMDHGIGQVAGLTPQGYLAVVAGKLVVPCGAQLPAFLDLETGRLDTYCMGWGGRVGLPKGSWFVAGAGKFLSHGGDLYDATQRNEERFRKPPNGVDFKSQLYAGALLRLHIDPRNQRALGPFQEPVLTPDTIYCNEPNIAAYDLVSGKLRDPRKGEVPPHRKDDQYPDRLTMDFERKWNLSATSKVHIKAGRSLVVGRPGAVEVVRIPQGDADPRVTWRTEIEGTPHRVLAADGKLFVVTREGSIFTFGREVESRVVAHELPSPPARATGPIGERVARVLERTRVDDGYVVVLGFESERFLEELVRQTSAFVIAVDRDAERVDQARRRLQRSGLYGTRTSVHAGDPLSFPFPPFLANLVVSENWERAALRDPAILADAVSFLLRPYGGIACLSAERFEGIREKVDGPEGARLTVQSEGDLLLLKREGALPRTADWSHARANAANTGATADAYVKAPLDLLWFDGALRWHRKPGGAEVRVAGGRVLVKAAELHALDVYTGRVLWVSDLPFSHAPLDQLAAVDGAILVTSGKTCFVLDPETGKAIRRHELPADFPGSWVNLRVAGDHIIGQSGQHVFCMGRGSGEIMWRLDCASSQLSVAVGHGKVFCAEIANKRRGETPQSGRTRAIDLASGKTLWEVRSGSKLAYSEEHGLLATATGIYRGRDGTRVAETSSFPRLYQTQPCELLSVVGDHVLWGTQTSYLTFDLSTGKPVDNLMAWVRRGCTTLRASTHLVTTRFKANCAYIDLATREITSLWNVRPGCNNNLFPANGILNIPNLTGGCECNYTPTSQAYVPRSVIVRKRSLREF